MKWNSFDGMAVFSLYVFFLAETKKKWEPHRSSSSSYFLPECTYSKYSLGGSHPIIRFLAMMMDLNLNIGFSFKRTYIIPIYLLLWKKKFRDKTHAIQQMFQMNSKPLVFFSITYHTQHLATDRISMHIDFCCFCLYIFSWLSLEYISFLWQILASLWLWIEDQWWNWIQDGRRRRSINVNVYYK